MSEFRFPSISLEQMFRIQPNVVYAYILTRSRFGMLPVIFHKFVTVMALIYVRILFPLNNWRTNGHNFAKFCICIYINKI